MLSMQWLWLIAEDWLFTGAFSLRRHVSQAVVQHDSCQELAAAFPLEATSVSGITTGSPEVVHLKILVVAWAVAKMDRTS